MNLCSPTAPKRICHFECLCVYVWVRVPVFASLCAQLCTHIYVWACLSPLFRAPTPLRSQSIKADGKQTECIQLLCSYTLKLTRSLKHTFSQEGTIRHVTARRRDITVGENEKHRPNGLRMGVGGPDRPPCRWMPPDAGLVMRSRDCQTDPQTKTPWSRASLSLRHMHCWWRLSITHTHTHQHTNTGAHTHIPLIIHFCNPSNAF